MAISIDCPHCHRRLEVPGDHCLQCGLALPPGVVYALATILGGTPAAGAHGLRTATPATFAPANPLATLYPPEARQTPPGQHSALRPWLAALLSCVCGLGQLYNGQVSKGVMLLIGGGIAVYAWPWFPGKIAAGLLWVYAISDAYLAARQTRTPAPAGQRGVSP